MLTSLDVYLVTECGQVGRFLTVVAVIAFLTAVVGGIMYVVNHDEDEDISRLGSKLFKVAGTMTLMASFLAVLTPTTPAAAAIYIIPAIADSKIASQVPKVMELELNRWEKSLEQSAVSKVSEVSKKLHKQEPLFRGSFYERL